MKILIFHLQLKSSWLGKSKFLIGNLSFFKKRGYNFKFVSYGELDESKLCENLKTWAFII